MSSIEGQPPAGRSPRPAIILSLSAPPRGADTVEVLAGGELGRVYPEDRCRHSDQPRRSRLGNQCHVPGVERAHGRHERQPIGFSGARRPRAPILHWLRTICTPLGLASVNLSETGRGAWTAPGKDQAMSQPHFIVFALNEKGGTGKSTDGRSPRPFALAACGPSRGGAPTSIAASGR